MFKKILIPIDGSKEAAEAGRFAVDFAICVRLNRGAARRATISATLL